MAFGLILLLIVVLTGILSEGLRRRALAIQLLDIPNERSSHNAPTPRGAGLAIVVVVLLAAIAATVVGRIPLHLASALIVGGAAVAFVGLADDYRHLSAQVRLLIHFAAASWAVIWLGGMPVLAMSPLSLDLGWLGGVLAALGIVWMINLYNFMDGIDGLAGVEAVSVGGFAALLLSARGHQDLVFLAAVLAAASAGFLSRNWPPARVFMGDVGSGFIGFCFGALALAADRRGALPAALWLLLLGVFVIDATATLLRRLARRERVYTPHRSHAYQRLTQAGWSHRRVTLSVLAINVLLAACAWAAISTGAVAVLTGIVVGGLFVLYTVVQLRTTQGSAGAS